MSYGFHANDYGCFKEELLNVLQSYITPMALQGRKFIDLTLGNVDDSVTIFKNMKDIQVDYDSKGTELTPLVIQLQCEYIRVIFEKTGNGIYVTVILNNKDNTFKKPKIFIPTLIMFNN